MNLECFVEDLFLGGQWSIILGYRRLSVRLPIEWITVTSCQVWVPESLSLDRQLVVLRSLLSAAKRILIPGKTEFLLFELLREFL